MLLSDRSETSGFVYSAAGSLKSWLRIRRPESNICGSGERAVVSFLCGRGEVVVNFQTKILIN